MAFVEHPLAQLRALAKKGHSGEFICAAATAEVHVFLQRGRVAWATDSSRPFEFARKFKQIRDLDDETFRTAVDACRRDRLPLGETLVAWNLASWSEVRAALMHQLALALCTLSESEGASTLFLERRWNGDYDERLTFEMADLIGDSPGPQSRAWPSTARDLLGAIRGAEWVQLREENRSVEIAGASANGGVSPSLARMTLGNDADFVALRSADGCLVGTVLADSDRQVWFMLSADSTFGAALGTLSSLRILPPRTLGELAASPTSIAWRHSELPGVEANVLEEVFEYGRDVLAVAVLSSQQDFLSGIGRASLDRSECAAVARRRAPVFASAPHDVPPDGALGALGFQLHTMMTGESSVWCFGAEARAIHPGATLWVMTRRDGAQGIGWACLTALWRRLSVGRPPDA